MTNELAEMKIKNEISINLEETEKLPQKSLSELKVEITFHLKQMAGHTIEIGNLLIEAKEQVNHGEWKIWLEENFNLSYRTAKNFMDCAERFGTKMKSISLLKPTQLIAMLSLPEGEEEKFIAEKAAEGNPIEDMTIKNLREEIKKYEEKLSNAEQESEHNKKRISAFIKENLNLQSDKTELQEKIEKLQSENESLESEKENLQNELEEIKDRPIEVATEYPADYESTKAELEELREKIQQKDSTEQKLAEFFSYLPFLSTIDYNNFDDAIKKYANKNPEVMKMIIKQFGKVQMRLNNVFKILKF